MSRQIIDAKVIESLLANRGITLPKRGCCGKPPKFNGSYQRYLKMLGYKGDLAVRSDGIITEITHID